MYCDAQCNLRLIGISQDMNDEWWDLNATFNNSFSHVVAVDFIDVGKYRKKQLNLHRSMMNHILLNRNGVKFLVTGGFSK